MAVTHIRLRPGWTCSECGDPWPCLPSRTVLLAEFAGRRAQLRMLLGAYFADALRDFAEAGDFDREALHARFFDWTGRTSAPPLPGAPRWT